MKRQPDNDLVTDVNACYADLSEKLGRGPTTEEVTECVLAKGHSDEKAVWRSMKRRVGAILESSLRTALNGDTTRKYLPIPNPAGGGMLWVDMDAKPPAAHVRSAIVERARGVQMDARRLMRDVRGYESDGYELVDLIPPSIRQLGLYGLESEEVA